MKRTNHQLKLEELQPIPRVLKAAKSLLLFNEGPIVIARAPGRLDVMGGIADYSGSVVCEMPLAVAAGVAVQARKDGKVVCASAQMRSPVMLDESTLVGADAVSVRKLLVKHGWSRYVIGSWWWLLQQRPQLAGHGGVTILVDSDVPAGGGVSSSAALEVASLLALSTLVNHRMTPLQIAAAGQAVENKVVGAPCGLMDQIASAMGLSQAMLEILCRPLGKEPAQVRGPVAVPSGFAFVGLHSGVSHEVSGNPYADARVAAFMGQKILSVLETPDLTGGFLSNVDADRYRRELRAQLPERLTGRAFLAKYGSTNDPVAPVRPEAEYHVRVGTDHHVFEMERVTYFIALMRKAAAAPAGAKRDAVMAAAGELMYASHRSYSECALLGHPMTDKLVDMARQLGPEKGFFGAKITGGGSGGTVCFLIRDDAATRVTLQQLKASYESTTKRRTMYFDGTSTGGCESGTLTLSPRMAKL